MSQDVQTAIRNVDTAKNAVLNADGSDEEALAGKVQDWQDANKALGDALSNVKQDNPGDTGATDSAPSDTTVVPDETATPPEVH